MKIILLNQDEENLKSIRLGSKFFILESKNLIKFENENYQVFLEGNVYYYKNPNGELIQFSSFEDTSKAVLSIIEKNKISDISSILEGEYIMVIHNKLKDITYIINDYVNRRHLFYTHNDGSLILSSMLSDVLNKGVKRYNQHALYSYLTMGYSPSKDTFYDGVRRLDLDQLIEISKDEVRFVSWTNDISIEEYQKTKMEEYEKILENAVNSRASNDGNVIMNSGGWDSTTLIYLLSKNFDSDKLSSAVFEVKLKDGQIFNVFEVDKVKRISKHFNISSETCTIDYGNMDSIDLLERSKERMRDQHVYFWVHHLKLAEQVGQSVDSGRSIFNGEASDSIHNFGFSQFVSVNYDEMGLREYADKGKSYLYGPSFFRKVINGSFMEDKVYGFFRNYYGDDKFVKTEKHNIKESYLASFALSYPRIPLANWSNERIAVKESSSRFNQYISEHYISSIADDLTAENLYYHLLQIYRKFHFQSPQIKIANVAFQPFGNNLVMPFLDLEMINFMYKMPENWGRGLELKTTKYPLRYLANERWTNMPINILEESGPHSYIAENDKKWSYSGGHWDIYCEILYNSVFKDYFISILENTELTDYFDADYFDIDFLNSIKNDYIKGKQDWENHALVFRIALLFSIGLH